jgi:hypothetical protein
MSGASPAGRNFPAQISEGARAITRARFPAWQGGSTRLARAQKNRPRASPGSATHFWSFNFTNSLICGIVSSAKPTSRSSDARSLRHLASYMGSGPKNPTASALARRRNSAMSSLSLVGFFANFPQPERIRPLSFEFGLHERVGEYLRLFQAG